MIQFTGSRAGQTIKPRLFAGIIAVIALFSISACSKNNNSSAYYMEASIASNNFKGAYCTGYIQAGSLIVQGGNYSGSTLLYPSITLTVANFSNSVGTFLVDGVINHAVLDSSVGLSLVGTTGTI